jgi:DNA-binding winged helix-turn-helix (wHTH) protein
MMENRSLADDLPKKGESDARGRGAEDPAASLLARRPDFHLGSGIVRPSVRMVEGPGGSVTAEPRVMQVLLALADAGGAVLTRDDLLRTCWKGMFVGDDAITRAVAEVRRIARETSAGFGIETIPRIGYRLTGGAATSTRPLAEPGPVPAPVAATPEPIDPIPLKATRRWIIGGALAATGAVAFGVWTAFRPRPDPRYLELLDRGKQALRMGLPASNQQGVEIFQEAVAIRPDDAAAWGLLALAKSHVADRSPSRSAGSNFQDSEQAARRALALDEREPNALFVLAMMQRNLCWRSLLTTLRRWMAWWHCCRPPAIFRNPGSSTSVLSPSTRCVLFRSFARRLSTGSWAGRLRPTKSSPGHASCGQHIPWCGTPGCSSLPLPARSRRPAF